MLIKPLQLLIRAYQLAVSPLLGANCRFYPSCSAYAHEALEKHGVFKGMILSMHRLARCHPWTTSGWLDPVPDQFAWREVFRYNRPAHPPKAACGCAAHSQHQHQTE